MCSWEYYTSQPREALGSALGRRASIHGPLDVPRRADARAILGRPMGGVQNPLQRSAAGCKGRGRPLGGAAGRGGSRWAPVRACSHACTCDRARITCPQSHTRALIPARRIRLRYRSPRTWRARNNASNTQHREENPSSERVLIILLRVLSTRGAFYFLAGASAHNVHVHACMGSGSDADESAARRIGAGTLAGYTGTAPVRGET